MEQHLSIRTNELFDIEDKIMLYDLTNTYFEGRKEGSKLAKYGRSKEKRSDEKLVVLALVVNPEGFIKYSSILEGNMANSKTLEGMIDKLRIKTSSSAKKALVVIDAMAHLHLGLLAYSLVNTVRHQLKKEGIHSGWRELVRTMNTQKAVTTLAQNNNEEVIMIRR